MRKWATKDLWSVRTQRLDFQGEETRSGQKASKRQNAGAGCFSPAEEKADAWTIKEEVQRHSVEHASTCSPHTPLKEKPKMKAAEKAPQEEGPSRPQTWVMGLLSSRYLHEHLCNWVVIFILFKRPTVTPLSNHPNSFAVQMEKIEME